MEYCLFLGVERVIGTVYVTVPLIVEPGTGFIDGENVGFDLSFIVLIDKVNRMAAFSAAFVGFDDDYHGSVF